MLIVRPATSDDIAQWLEIVREVEPLFGPMPDFAEPAARGIARGTALVVSDGPAVLGACLLSPDDPALLSNDDMRQEIRWIAVRESSRRQGIGTLMLRGIERRWPDGDIHVVTFAESVEGGAPARRFYESNGFELSGRAHPASDGAPRDLYVLPGANRVRR